VLAAEAARVVAAATAARDGRPPVLAAVVATEEIDALIYMEQLLKQAATAGLAVKKISLAATASEAEISATLQRLSEDPDVAGIILQSPLPSGVDRARVVAAIDPQKDVDGATAANAARLTAGDLDGTLLPATAAAVMELLRAHEIPLHGQRAVVVGRSAVVGGPVAQLLALAGAQVEVVHSKTPDMGAITRTAQILVVAAGVRGLVRGEHVAPGCVVIDVGIHADGDRIMGDVDAESVSAAIGESGALSPVPGGVGPMTNAILVLQAAQAAARRAGA
jgi:methylenetetrahydrofolate dehydrogenase (NADP+)/methenyltetrahydrofolate cyclohydrolase